MTAKDIVQVGSGRSDAHNFLRQVAVAVTESSLKEAEAIVADLIDTMKSQPLCVGLAANQIGSNLRVAVIQDEDNDAGVVIMYNPEIIQLSGKKDKKRESCMSVWGFSGEVERRYKVVVRYCSSDLVAAERTFTGFPARIVQHEIDHLNGILYCDHVSPGGLQATDLFDNYSPLAGKG